MTARDLCLIRMAFACLTGGELEVRPAKIIPFPLVRRPSRAA